MACTGYDTNAGVPAGQGWGKGRIPGWRGGGPKGEYRGEGGRMIPRCRIPRRTLEHGSQSSHVHPNLETLGYLWNWVTVELGYCGTGLPLELGYLWNWVTVELGYLWNWVTFGT
eukprot:scaffold12114_cov79-Isochrysis_galbana.AAC.1